MNPLALSSTLAQMWIDGSVQAARSAAEFWNGVLSSGMNTGIGGGATRTSTAAPWWKAPETRQTSLPVLYPLNWASLWAPVASSTNTSPDFAQFWHGAWAPWLPRSAAVAPTAFSTMEFWQQAWLRNMPQLAGFTASQAGAGGAGATWPSAWPTMAPAAPTTPVPAAWQPMMAAYRTANGHAMAAVLRTIADVVEPKPRQPNIMDYWQNPLGTRH